MTKVVKHQCSEDMVRSTGVWGRYHQCVRNGKIERNGKWYCKQHDPVAIKKKRDDESAAWKAERDGSEAKGNAARMLAERLGCGSPHYHHPARGGFGEYSGGLVISKEDVEKLLERLEREK